MKFYGLKTCDTCRKARKELDAAGMTYDYIDVRADGVDAATLTKWVAAHGRKTVLNTRSTTWRALGDDIKALDTDADALALMIAHPTLIKRPVIEQGGESFVGWSKANQAAILG